MVNLKYIDVNAFKEPLLSVGVCKTVVLCIYSVQLQIQLGKCMNDFCGTEQSEPLEKQKMHGFSYKINKTR